MKQFISKIHFSPIFKLISINFVLFQFHSAVFTRLLLNTKLLDAVEDIMDSQNIVLHHTKAHLKVKSSKSYQVT